MSIRHKYYRLTYDRQRKRINVSKRSTLINQALLMLHEAGVCSNAPNEDCLAKFVVAQFLGYRDPVDMYNNYDRIDQSKLEQLAGPHGFTIYKAWKAKHEQ